MLSLIEKDMF
jgi:Domain of unknown function (DUF3381)